MLRIQWLLHLPADLSSSTRGRGTASRCCRQLLLHLAAALARLLNSMLTPGTPYVAAVLQLQSKPSMGEAWLACSMLLLQPHRNVTRNRRRPSSMGCSCRSSI